MELEESFEIEASMEIEEDMEIEENLVSETVLPKELMEKTANETVPTDELVSAKKSQEYTTSVLRQIRNMPSKKEVPIRNKAISLVVVGKKIIKQVINKDSVLKEGLIENVIWDEWKKKGKQVMLKNIKSLVGWRRKQKLKQKLKQKVKEKGKIKEKQRPTKTPGRRRDILKRKLGPMRQAYDLFSHYLHGKLRLEDVLEACKILMRAHKAIPSTISDVLSIFDCQTSAIENSEIRRKLAKLCKSLEKVISREILLERLEMDSLLEFSLVPTKQFISRSVKIKTKLFYKQKKFNLYREESEGYSKLLVELSKANATGSNPDIYLGHVKSLIGYFNLDPNRVLDAVLNAFELRPTERRLFSFLMNLYVRDKNRLREVLGFRYAYYHKKSSETPKSVYILTVILIQEDILSLEDVLIWLHPDESEIMVEMEDRYKVPEKKQPVTRAPGSAMKVVKVAGNDPSKYQSYLKNQKLVLCETFLEMGDWENFKAIMKKIGPRYVMSYPPVALSLCKLIHYLIDPLYLKHFKFGSKLPRSERTFNVTPHTPEQAQTFLDLKNIFPMFYALKSALGYDPVLLFKISRVVSAGVEAITEDIDNPELDVKTIYYDGITLLDEVLLPTLTRLNSPCCASETIWKLLKLYPFTSRYALYGRWKSYCEKHHVLVEKKLVEEYNIKVGMKRVSKENVKQVGRLFGKATHFCPPALFNYILNMVSMYDNLIGPVVEALRYLNTTSCDVLGYCILEFFLKEKVRKNQTDGHSLAQWFQNVALFSALSHKKLSIDVSGMIHYVGQELVTHNCLDLLLLKELLLKVTGIEIGDDLPNHQYGANGEGELSKATEAANFTRNFKRSSIRLREALSKLKLTAPLAIMLAQERNNIAHGSNEDIHIKLLGRLYDECHDVLLQFGTFLYTSAMLPELREFPCLDELLSIYNLDLDAAFFLSKPAIFRSVHETLTAIKQDKTKPVLNSFLVLSDVIKSLSDVIKKTQPPKVWDEISPSFVVLFWSLNLYDIHIPTSMSFAEHKKSFQAAAIMSNARGAVNFPSLEAALNEQKDTWFIPGTQRPAKNDVITWFLQLCILRRCIFSPSDALYCAHFIQLLHKLRTENFSTLLCYDRLLCDITYMATSCTENEATRYGQFLLAVLQDVMRWHSSKDIYDKECALTPGFVTKFRGSLDGAANDNIHYENYRHVCHKWHFKLTKSLLTLLESKDYVQIRNGMIILIKLLPQFPMISKLAQCIEKGINKIKEDEKKVRQDLYTLAVSYSGQLSAKMKTMIKESDFHKVLNSPSPPSSVAATAPAEEKTGESSAVITNHTENNKHDRPPSKQRKSNRASAEETESKGSHKSKDKKQKDKESKQVNEEEQQEKKLLISGEALTIKDKDALEKEQNDKGKEPKEKEKEKESKSRQKDLKIKDSVGKEKESKEREVEDKERKEKEKKDKKEKEQKDKDRKEKDLREKERKEKENKEKELKEKELKDRLDKESKDKERKDKELKEKKEKDIKEKERKEKEFKTRKDKEVKDRKEKDLKDKERKEKEIKDRERKDKEVKDKDRKERELKDKDRKEKETKEKERKEKELRERREKENKEKERREKETKDKERRGKDRKEKETKEKDRKEKEPKEKKDKDLKDRKEKDPKDRKDKEIKERDRKEKDKKENESKDRDHFQRKRGSPINWSSSSESEFRGYESPILDTNEQRKKEFFMSIRNKVYKREPLSSRRCEDVYYNEDYSDDDISHESWYEPYIPLSKDEAPALKRSVCNRNNYYSKSNLDGVVTVDSKRRKVEMPSVSKVPKYVERQFIISHEKKPKRGRPRKDNDVNRFRGVGQRERTPGSRDRNKSYTSDSWKMKWR